jgi:hypothetical protein
MEAQKEIEFTRDVELLDRTVVKVGERKTFAAAEADAFVANGRAKYLEPAPAPAAKTKKAEVTE